MRKILIILSTLCLLLFTAFKSIDNRFELSKNLEIFAAVYKQLDLNYVEEIKPGKLMRTGIDAMLKSLDPYTVFYSEAQAEDALTKRTGEYGGLGISVTKIENYLVVTDIFEGYSADKAGVHIGDKIIQVNGKNFKDKTNEDLSPVMRGAKGTKVNITLDRMGVGLLTLDLERVEVKMKNVAYSGMANDEVGYIHLTNFMQGAANEVKEALINLKKEGCKSLILDLRDNPGGLLFESVDIVNIFIPQNELVVFTKGKSDVDYKEYKTRGRPTDLSIPVVVMVNERSASASEIVSGTLQDLDRAVVVGSNSFGKGLVQTTRPLPYRTQMKITTAKYYTPSGRCIQSLNYSQKDVNGKAIKTADSLRQEFKTRNGRKVLDGGGILPDVEIEFKGELDFINQLKRQYLIFDYSVKAIADNNYNELSERFKITTEDYKKFTNWVKNAGERIETNTDKAITVLEKTSEQEDVKLSASSITALKEESWKQKEKVMTENQSLLMDLISLEVIRQKGLEKMHYKGKFKKDPATLKSLEVIQNSSLYINILKGK